MMQKSLDNLPKEFSDEDKENIKSLMEVKQEEPFTEILWLDFLIDKKKIQKTKESTERALEVGNLSLNTKEVLEIVKELVNEIHMLIQVYSLLDRESSIKILKNVTDEMIYTYAEFKLAYRKHIDFMRNEIHKNKFGFS